MLGDKLRMEKGMRVKKKGGGFRFMMLMNKICETDKVLLVIRKKKKSLARFLFNVPRK